MTIIYNPTWSNDRRRYLRRNMTSAEVKLWQFIRNRQLGIKFRRQFGIGPYIIDFFSPTLRLAIEIDGDSHFTLTGQAYDDIRDAYLAQLHIKTVRFDNNRIHFDLEGVLNQIRTIITNREEF